MPLCLADISRAIIHTFTNTLPFVDAEKEAGEYQIYARYAIEKAAAHASTVFTTVSEVTNYEAAKLLGRAPDAILPNGLKHSSVLPHRTNSNICTRNSRNASTIL